MRAKTASGLSAVESCRHNWKKIVIVVQKKNKKRSKAKQKKME